MKLRKVKEDEKSIRSALLDDLKAKVKGADRDILKRDVDKLRTKPAAEEKKEEIADKAEGKEEASERDKGDVELEREEDEREEGEAEEAPAARSRDSLSAAIAKLSAGKR